MRELWESLRFAAAAFVVAALPERVKARQPWRSYSTVAAHAASGAVEAAVATVLFGMGFLAWVGEFSGAFGLAFALGAPSPTTGDLGRLGILGYVSYLLTPWAMATFFCLVEGVLRALDALLLGRHLGMAFLSLPHWAFLAARDRSRRARLERRLGPPRADRIALPKASREGALEVVSRDAKPWSDLQVVELGGHFFQLREKALVPDGAYVAWRYRFAELDPNAVIRGRVVPLEAAPLEPPPPPAAPARRRRWLEALLVRRPPGG